MAYDNFPMKCLHCGTQWFVSGNELSKVCPKCRNPIELKLEYPMFLQFESILDALTTDGNTEILRDGSFILEQLDAIKETREDIKWETIMLRCLVGLNGHTFLFNAMTLDKSCQEICRKYLIRHLALHGSELLDNKDVRIMDYSVLVLNFWCAISGEMLPVHELAEQYRYSVKKIKNLPAGVPDVLYISPRRKLLLPEDLLTKGELDQEDKDEIAYLKKRIAFRWEEINSGSDPSPKPISCLKLAVEDVIQKKIRRSMEK